MLYAAAMSQSALRRMTAEEFLQWDLDQPDARHELIDGVPVAMTGARRRHDRIVVNALSQLDVRLRGGPCEAFTPDTAVRIPNGNVRRPDAGVVCGPDDDDLTYAAAPRLVIEVLSPTTRAFDLARKLEEYKSIASLDYILLVDPDMPEVILWSRSGARGWEHTVVEGLESTIDLPALRITLPLADLYARVRFEPPR